MRLLAGMIMIVLVLGMSAGVLAQDAIDKSDWAPLSLTQDGGGGGQGEQKPADAAAPAEEEEEEAEAGAAESKHWGVDDFFNIREANSDVKACEWQLELESGWSTNSDGSDDDWWITPGIKYGITDSLYVGLRVLPLNLGDGTNQRWADGGEFQNGNGDLALQIFHQCMREPDYPFALATWAEMRIPTGDGSEKVDATFHLTLSKELIPDCWRLHLDGYIMTANGARGDAEDGEDDDGGWGFGSFSGGLGGGWGGGWSGNVDSEGYDRRHFQWGIGPGMDFKINECNVLVLNYLNRSSEGYGRRNQNLVEAGWVYQISDSQQLKASVESELHNEGEPGEADHWSAKMQYSIAW